MHSKSQMKRLNVVPMQRRLVKDAFDIDEDELLLKSEESDYWQGSYDFYVENKNHPVHYMSEKQEEWLNKIETDLKE